MKVLLLRHGKTAGNIEKRYVGTTDELLSEEGITDLVCAAEYQNVEAVYVSPMLRCVQTADILFPGMEKIIVDDFRECDFGLFEYKNYMELKDDSRYQKWLDSNGILPFPEGESREEFQKRCVRAFEGVIQDAKNKGVHTIACVVHGGTIMSILDVFSDDGGSYYDFQVQNGDGFLAEITSLNTKFEHMIDFKMSICYSIKHGNYTAYKEQREKFDG
ncbi:MAG: histidine phosphatase family protein [Eubacteriales bacterium]|nr:histidine phosphatase family protein [Eubacteriales bacterium]